MMAQNCFCACRDWRFKGYVSRDTDLQFVGATVVNSCEDDGLLLYYMYQVQ